MADHLKSFDPAAIIRSCLNPAWGVEAHAGEIRITTPAGQLAGTVRPDPNRPWKCRAMDAAGAQLTRKVGPSEAAEVVAKHALALEVAHA